MLSPVPHSSFVFCSLQFAFCPHPITGANVLNRQTNPWSPREVILSSVQTEPPPNRHASLPALLMACYLVLPMTVQHRTWSGHALSVCRHVRLRVNLDQTRWERSKELWGFRGPQSTAKKKRGSSIPYTGERHFYVGIRELGSWSPAAQPLWGNQA